MTIYSWMYAILGAVIGSFLNVVIDRLPLEQSISKPPSHCPSCGKRIQAYDLIPVVSFLILRGRCRYCKEKIPFRVFFVELFTGAAFYLIWGAFGQSWETVVVSLYSSTLIAIGFIDLEHRKVLNVLVYPAIWIGLIMVPLLHFEDFWIYLAAGAAGFAALFLIAVIAPGAMGMGDVKLILFLGLITGFPEVILVLFLAFILGGLTAGILLLLKKIGRKDSIAFGPFLALAGFITLLYGTQILDWWRSLVSG
ncbi:MAG: prepilin peptidase [Anaerolineales bacterium]